MTLYLSKVAKLAFKITELSVPAGVLPEAYYVTVDTGDTYRVEFDVFARAVPEKGDMLIFYPATESSRDGYTSWCPAGPFFDTHDECAASLAPDVYPSMVKVEKENG